MKKTRYIRWILLAEAVGGLSGFLSRKGMQAYNLSVQKPSFTPPNWLFPVAWVILYALMGIGAARVESSPQGKLRSRSLNLYIVQLIVNFFWSLIFFNAGAYGAALLWLLILLVLAAAMTLAFYRVDKAVGLLQIPYLLWLSFAAVLNYGVWQLNP